MLVSMAKRKNPTAPTPKKPIPEEVVEYMRQIGSKGGRKGGKAKVKKGFALLSAAGRRKIALKGVEGRRRKQEPDIQN